VAFNTAIDAQHGILTCQLLFLMVEGLKGSVKIQNTSIFLKKKTKNEREVGNKEVRESAM
jgi:hypothetical protein